MKQFYQFTGQGVQTEVTFDQTIFVRTHVLGALQLHCLEKASSALLSGQWCGTCLIRSYFGLGQSDERLIASAHKSNQRKVSNALYSDQTHFIQRTLFWRFERTLV